MLKKVCFLFLGVLFVCIASQTYTRFPAVSGQFYPASAEVLKNDINTYLLNVDQKGTQPVSKVLGLIVPHAGYQYSGQTAAYAYEVLKNHKIDTVILIGPFHADNFKGVSIWPQGVWQTPLGNINIDESLANNIRDESPDFLYDPGIHLAEHSLEVQVPYIQVVAPNAKIVPILISDLSYAKPLADALFKHIYGKSVLVIASTDLSHYHPDEIARKIDEKTQLTFQSLSPEAFKKAYQNREIELCGPAAVLTLMELSQLYGQCEFTNLNYANSGATFTDKSSVVGYNASLISLSDKIPPQKGQILLNVARETLLAYLSNRNAPTFTNNDPLFNQNRAVFVTLRDSSGKLRGCVGQLEPIEPLFLAVQHMSIDAATKDLRFAPISLTELKDLSIEISVLDAPQRIQNIKEFVYGMHGVVLTQGRKRGVFLPEVAKDFPTKEEFLSELCYQKADLPKNCWQNPLTEMQVFTTQVIQSLR